MTRARAGWGAGVCCLLAAIGLGACHSSGATGGAGGGDSPTGGAPGNGGGLAMGSGGAAGWGGTTGIDAAVSADAADDVATDASLLAREDQACRQAIIVQCQRCSR